MGQVLFILLMVLIAFAAAIIIPTYLTNRATVKVIKIFREHEANDFWSAKTASQLGIGPRGLFDRLVDPRRDYKPMALGALIKIGVVRQTGNKRLYLNEKSLADFCHQTENRMKACSLVSQRDR
jgi:hypothetical protein